MTDLDLSFLGRQEQYILRLRGLYERSGYRRYEPLRFESYDFYAGNRDFLVGSSILNFTDLNGKLMALRPDVTLSIVKEVKPDSDLARLYYHENVYREAHGAKEFRQLSQIGIEVIGTNDQIDQKEILRLASDSLSMTGARCALLISHMGFITGLLDEVTHDRKERAHLLRLIGDKNLHELKRITDAMALPSQTVGAIEYAASSQMDFDAGALFDHSLNDKMKTAAQELSAILQDGIPGVRCDLSVTDDPGYYNGVVMRGYVDGVPRPVLSGGRYDMLMKRMKKEPLCGFGFAVYLNELERLMRQEENR